jgi:hypothetical protein
MELFKLDQVLQDLMYILVLVDKIIMVDKEIVIKEHILVVVDYTLVFVVMEARVEDHF